MSKRDTADWREPLYECAVSQKEDGRTEQLLLALRGFSMLGDYGDAASLRAACAAEAEKRLENALKSLDADYSAAKKALKEIEAFRSVPEYRERTECVTLTQEELLAGEISAVKKKTKKRRAAVMIAAVLAAVLCICWAGPVQDHMVERSVRMEEEGDYRGALSICWRLLFGPRAGTGKERIPVLQEKLAGEMAAGGNYEEAADLFYRAGNKEASNAAYRAWGEELLKAGDYEVAREKYRLAEDEEGEQAVCIAWGRDLKNKGEYTDAIDILADAGDSAEAAELLSECRDLRCEQTIRSIPGLKEDVEKLREAGEKIDDLDGQLRFCAALFRAGIDPGEVYPDGVAVADLPLEEYPALTQSSVQELQAAKILVLKREKQPGRKSDYQSISRFSLLEEAADRLEKQPYSVRLMPGDLYRLPEQYRAGSLDECGMLLIADTNWTPTGIETLEKSYKTNINGRYQTVSNMSYYPKFSVSDAVALYDKNVPENALLFDRQTAMSKIAADPGAGIDFQAIKEEADRFKEKYREEASSGADGAESSSEASESDRQETDQDYEQYWEMSDDVFLRKALTEAVDRITENVSSQPAQ